MKRIILCADGTWNIRDQVNKETQKRRPTNVTKVARAILPRGPDGTDQIVYYHDGIGTGGPLDTLTGGAFGEGMGGNVRNLYRFIVYNYEPGDEIFLFGFSRGAFTVRTLAGFMNKVGLFQKNDDYYVPDIYSCYESDEQPGSPRWTQALHNVKCVRPCPTVKFIGVWDTVGALGAPGFLGQLLNGKKYKFHDVGLNPNIQNAFQALALDERRKPFTPNLWRRTPGWNGALEQAWFAGVHGNIGGGCAPDGLANEALHWIVEKAEALGLVLNQSYLNHYTPCFNSDLKDSMTKLYRLMGPIVRPVGQALADGEAVHQSAIDRINLPVCKYAPQNLADPTRSSLPVVNTTRVPRGTPCEPLPAVPLQKPDSLPKASMQVDMFEVQLGASLLLQFRTSTGVIRVLADGGQGGPVDIQERLNAAMLDFEGRERRIDLLIGTHYDSDHLAGLVPIINDSSIKITEAWLPPVANDVDSPAMDEPLSDEQLLAHQLASSEGHWVLARYLDAKDRVCAFLRPTEGEGSPERRSILSADRNELDRLHQRFVEHRAEALEMLRSSSESYSHADESQEEPKSLEELTKLAEPHYRYWLGPRGRGSRFTSDFELREFARTALSGIHPQSIAAANLSGIRKAAATDAINAISLAKVVQALDARNIPIRCHVIPDGTPARFTWRAKAGCFQRGQYKDNLDSPTVTLLGPSESLVRKHRDRLPIGDYASLAFLARYEIKNITPSNQLSYVAHFGAQHQGILVTGDAGFVDFKRGRENLYSQALLDALAPLHVVQVAHHGGNNAHFYRVMRETNYPVARSFLLLSHATNDRHRPNGEFLKFAGDVRGNPGLVNLLFTAAPQPQKINGIEDLVHPPIGPTADRGDVRLEYVEQAWQVTKHAVAVTVAENDRSR